MPMWFVPRDGEVWIWTYGKSQKVKNLERDPRATILVETGHEYTELQGIQIEAEAELVRDTDEIVEFAKELTIRYGDGIDSVEGDAAAMLEAQAPKRVAIRFRPERVASWDHGSSVDLLKNACSISPLLGRFLCEPASIRYRMFREAGPGDCVSQLPRRRAIAALLGPGRPGVGADQRQRAHLLHRRPG